MKKRWIFLLSTSLLLSILGVTLWKSDALQRWLEKRVQDQIVREYLDKIAPHLPFKIEKVEVKATLKNFKAGRIPSLHVVLNWRNQIIDLQGALSLQSGRKLGELGIHYEAQAQVEHISDPIIFSLWAEGPKTLSHLSSFGLNAKLKHLAVQALGAAIEELSLETLWEDQDLFVDLKAKTLNWNAPHTDQHAVKLDGTHLRAQSRLKLAPFELAPEITGNLQALAIEALWDESYLDASLRRFSASFNISQNQLTPTVYSISLTQQARPLINFKHDLMSGVFRFQTSELDLPDLARLASHWTPLSSIKNFEITKGTLTAEGTVKQGAVQLDLKINDTDVHAPKYAAAIRGLRAVIPYRSKGILNGKIEIPEIFYRKFTGSLGPTEFNWNVLPSEHWSFTTPKPVELRIKNIPISLGSITGDDLGGFTSRIHIASFSPEALLQGFCIAPPRIPPSSVQLDFSDFRANNQEIIATGSIQATLFDGMIKAQDFKLTHLDSPIPELSMEGGWQNIQLTRFGNWLHFGEMDGTLQGYAKNVLLRDWTPTRFDFKIEVKPNLHSDIVFSPDAMKNIVRLFAGDNLDVLPGFANWLAFGWPSRVFGGYDVEYFGISAKSNDGSIVVETLDPPKILQKERTHFILYGPRFKMPLNSPRYPLVMDAAAMGNFASYVVKQLQGIAAKGQHKENEDVQNKKNSDLKGTSDCLPDFH